MPVALAIPVCLRRLEGMGAEALAIAEIQSTGARSERVTALRRFRRSLIGARVKLKRIQSALRLIALWRRRRARPSSAASPKLVCVSPLFPICVGSASVSRWSDIAGEPD